jgi:2,3-bisphosphoglycerate-dependent phosphoglycerate mutase
MQLVLIRHALPERAQGLVEGRHADPGLTDLGERQAKRLPDAIGPGVDALYSSPMARALATAAPLAAAVRREPVVLADLREFDAEHNEYLPVHEMARDNPEAWRRMLDGEFPIPVDTAAFGDRVDAAVEGIIAAHPGRATVVVVAHAGVINIWLARLLGLAKPLTFPLDYAGITRVLAGRDGRRIVRTVNETGHVADLLALPAAG